jgi:hypothetical protein
MAGVYRLYFNGFCHLPNGIILQTFRPGGPHNLATIHYLYMSPRYWLFRVPGANLPEGWCFMVLSIRWDMS